MGLGLSDSNTVLQVFGEMFKETNGTICDRWRDLDPVLLPDVEPNQDDTF